MTLFPIISTKRTTSKTISASQNDYRLARNYDVFEISADAGRSFSGFSGHWNGRAVLLVNVGSNSFDVLDESASSAAENRVSATTGATLAIAAGEVCALIYLSSQARWVAWEY